MPIDRKYGRVTLETGTIADDEPVVVFRAKDALLATLLEDYAEMCERAGSPEHHIAGVWASRTAVVEWQETHPTQVPQSAAPREGE